jgi:hypothetical protein
MKTTLWSCVIFGAAVALSAGIAAGGVGDLTYAKTAPPGVSSGGAYMPMKTPANRAAIGLTHPKALATSKGTMIAVAFDSADPKADSLDIARIDMTGKGEFTGAVTVKLTKVPSRVGYTMLSLTPQPITISKDGKKIPALLSGRYYKYKSSTTGTKTKSVMRVSCSAYVQTVGVGECKFGDTVRKICVTDNNRNMTLGDVVTVKSGTREYKRADYCRIADAKGTFATASRTGYVQMGQPFEIDGKWYTLSAEKMKIAATPMTGGLGTLTIDAPRWQCTLTRDGFTLNVTGGDKPVNVPAGEYMVRMFRLYRGADAAKPCANIYGSRTKPLTITADKATSLSAGTDLTAKMSASFSKGKVKFSVSQSDAAGSRIRGIYGAGGKRPTAPQIEVVNKAGKVVYTAKLAYG